MIRTRAPNPLMNKVANFTNYKSRRLRVDISYILCHFGYAPLKGIDKNLSPRREVVEMMKDVPVSAAQPVRVRVDINKVFSDLEKLAKSNAVIRDACQDKKQKRGDPGLGKQGLPNAKYNEALAFTMIKKNLTDTDKLNKKRKERIIQKRTRNVESSIVDIVKDEYLKRERYIDIFPKIKKAMEDKPLVDKVCAEDFKAPAHLKKSYLEVAFKGCIEEANRLRDSLTKPRVLMVRRKEAEEFAQNEIKKYSPLVTLCRTFVNYNDDTQKALSKAKRVKLGSSEEVLRYAEKVKRKFEDNSVSKRKELIEDELIKLENRFDLLKNLPSDDSQPQETFNYNSALVRMGLTCIKNKENGVDPSEAFLQPKLREKPWSQRKLAKRNSLGDKKGYHDLNFLKAPIVNKRDLAVKKYNPSNADNHTAKKKKGNNTYGKPVRAIINAMGCSGIQLSRYVCLKKSRLAFETSASERSDRALNKCIKRFLADDKIKSSNYITMGAERRENAILDLYRDLVEKYELVDRFAEEP